MEKGRIPNERHLKFEVLLFTWWQQKVHTFGDGPVQGFAITRLKTM